MFERPGREKLLTRMPRIRIQSGEAVFQFELRPSGVNTQRGRTMAQGLLGIKEKAAGMRYVRALRRLKEILQSMPGTFEV